MGFDLTKKKRIRKKRKRSRKKQQTPVRYTIEMIPIVEEYPPNGTDLILVYEYDCGYDIRVSGVALQHIRADMSERNRKPLITHWGKL